LLIFFFVIGIRPKLLKELSLEVAPCLNLVFKASIKQSTLPKDWKTALVTPISKRAIEVTLATIGPYHSPVYVVKY